MVPMRLSAIAVALGTCATLSVSSVAAAQSADEEYFSEAAPIAIGYVANAPHQLGGGSLLVMSRPFPSWGFFIDFKTGIDSPEGEDGFLSSGTMDDVLSTDILYETRELWRSANLGIVRSLTGKFAVYAGAGVSNRIVYRQYWDRFNSDRGFFGYYWLEDTDFETNVANARLGMMLRMTERLLLQFGAETNPRGFTFGISYALIERRL